MEINDYLNENGNDSALQVDANLGMTALHVLTMNPYASTGSIAALLNSNMETIICLYARDYNAGGPVGMIVSLCNHKNSSIPDKSDSIQVHEPAAKIMRYER